MFATADCWLSRLLRRAVSIAAEAAEARLLRRWRAGSGIGEELGGEGVEAEDSSMHSSNLVVVVVWLRADTPPVIWLILQFELKLLCCD